MLFDVWMPSRSEARSACCRWIGVQEQKSCPAVSGAVKSAVCVETAARSVRHDPAMNGASVHHVGYLASDVERAAAQIGSQLGLEVTRRFERRQYSVMGVYLGVGPANIEVFSFTDRALVEPRLGNRLLLLDHVAYGVADIRGVAARMRAQGIRFTGPDGRAELTEPIDLGGVLHMWTDAASADGLAIQLVQE